MLHILIPIATATAMLAAGGVYICWFLIQAKPIWRTTARSALLRALLLIPVLVWIRPSYEGHLDTDADLYYRLATETAAAITAGQWSALPTDLGTTMMGYLGAALYLPTHTSISGLFIMATVISLVSATIFWSAVALWRGASNTSVVSYAVMYWPSILFWTGSFGKDNFTFLAFALILHGVSRRFSSRAFKGACVEMVAGMTLLTLIRPHYALAALSAIACAEAYSFFTDRGNRTKSALILGLLITAAGPCWNAVCAVVIGDLAESATERFVRSSELNAGDSNVDVPEITSVQDAVLQLPSAILRIYCRPWLWEARNPFAVLAAVENTVALILVAWNWRRVLNAGRLCLQQPCGVFCVVLAIALTLLSCTITNLGLLARTKTLILPFIAILVSGGKQQPSRSRRAVTVPLHSTTAPHMAG